MLNMFSTSTRKASHEADAIACWAAMCNLQYDYCKDDLFFVAQKKVLDAARRQGTKVYNFQANILGMSGEMHLDWLMYAYEQPLRNALHEARTVGAPCFTGVADFAQHLSASIELRPPVPLMGRGVALEPLVGAKIASITLAEEIVQVVEQLRQIQTGYWTGSPVELFRDVGMIARVNLEGTPPEQLAQFCLVVVSLREANAVLPFEPSYELPAEVPGGGFYLSRTVEFAKYAWAFVRKAHCWADGANLIVAREALNGTLVLTRGDMPPTRTTIIGYLTGVDFMSGAYLLPLDDEGKLDLTLHAPQRSDIQIAAKGGVYATRDRRVVGQFETVKGRGIVAY
jgi:hypothetical protein